MRDLRRAIIAAAQKGIGIRLTAEECNLLATQDYIRGNAGQSQKEWRRIPGYEAYEVSDEGDVRHGYRVLKNTISTRYRHANVSIYDVDGRQWRQGVHRLVALAFLGPAPDGKPYACHRNGRAWDNQKDNIYWGSHAENTQDMIRHGSLKRAIYGGSENSVGKSV